MQVYILEMQRFGDSESHHYLVGVYSTKEGANFAGDAEEEYRGGKYSKKITPLVVDSPVPNAWIHIADVAQLVEAHA